MNNIEEHLSVRTLINDAHRRKPEFMTEPGMDKALAAIMRLAMEVSVLRDRLDTHEALAERSGAYTSEEVECFIAGPERETKRGYRDQPGRAVGVLCLLRERGLV